YPYVGGSFQEATPQSFGRKRRSSASEVAQVSNLLYRRLPACRPSDLIQDLRACNALPIGNRRYGRLESCATRPARALARSPSLWDQGVASLRDAQNIW